MVSAVEGNVGQIEQICRTFGVDWPHLIAQVISFGLVYLVLHRFAFKPVGQILAARRKQIEQGLADAEKMKADLAGAEARSREILAEANAQALRSIAEAREAAAHVLEQETRKAVAAAEQIVSKAHEASAQDRDRMMAELKREVGRLVVQATTAVTGKVLTPDDQRRLAEETAKHMVP